MAKTRRGRGKNVLELSPSVLHRHLMNRMPQALGFTERLSGHVKAWQGRLRRKLRELVGWDRMPGRRCPLKVRALWRRRHALGTIEKIAFTAEEHADVPAFVCLPGDVPPPYAFFICLQGHTSGAHNSIAVDRDTNRQAIEVPGDRDFGLGCMARGVAALCIEQRSFGERREQVQERVAKHGCQDATMHALMLGRTLIGERVYDVDRGIDYLAARGDADMRRIGLMGNSGGGTVTLFAAALLERLAFAMPSCSFCTFRDSIMSIHHCMDNYVPGLLQCAEMADVLGLFAPRPVVVVAGRHDPIFPLAAARREFRRLQAVYRAAGAEQNCRLVVGPEGHRFYADLAWARMLPFVNRIR